MENKVHDRGSDRIRRDVLDTRFYFYWHHRSNFSGGKVPTCATNRLNVFRNNLEDPEILALKSSLHIVQRTFVFHLNLSGDFHFDTYSELLPTRCYPPNTNGGLSSEKFT